MTRRRGYKNRVPWAQWPPMAPMSTGDVARVLRCRARTVQILAAAGDLAGEQTWGGQWVFRRRDVEAFQKQAGGRLVPAVAAIATKAKPQLALRFPRVPRALPQPWGIFRMLKADLAKSESRGSRSGSKTAGVVEGKRHVA